MNKFDNYFKDFQYENIKRKNNKNNKNDLNNVKILLNEILNKIKLP